MNNDVKIIMLVGLAISASGLSIFMGFVYYSVYDEETVNTLQSMESDRRTIIIALVLGGAWLMIYQGHVFLYEGLKLQDKGSQSFTGVSGQ